MVSFQFSWIVKVPEREVSTGGLHVVRCCVFSGTKRETSWGCGVQWSAAIMEALVVPCWCSGAKL